MSDAFRESNTDTYRNVVTFQSGFGVIADQPFSIGSLTTTNSNLITYNQIKPLGGISGYVAYTGNSTGIYIPSHISGNTIQMFLNSQGVINRTLPAGNSQNVIDLITPAYCDSAGLVVIDLSLNQLQLNGDPRVDWANQKLFDNTSNMVLDWNNKIISGNWKITSLNLYSGNQQCFTTGIITTGLDTYNINYPLGAFSKKPNILLTVEVSGNNTYNVNITGRTPTGFYALFSDIIRESGVILHCLATIN